ncbi:hypothetical protein [Paenibacillus piri]|uniref:hypothetical protein n=1 Tax=Paenibacillus piri TaxID=2547395 RepID=UPI001FEC07C1|nr:hypothetical protein [Paenibacillus piri]
MSPVAVEIGIGPIPMLAKQLNDFQRSKEAGIEETKERLEKSLEGIERQIANIVNAIASGVSNATLIDKLEELEKQKLSIEQKLLEVVFLDRTGLHIHDAGNGFLRYLDALSLQDLPHLRV